MDWADAYSDDEGIPSMAVDQQVPPPDNTSDDSTSSPPFTAASCSFDRKFHLLLAATGSVATIKIPSILNALSTHPYLSIRLILSPSAKQFLKNQAPEQPTLAALRQVKNVDGIYLDEEEWKNPWKRGDGILHIELRRWADLMVIAPLSANSMAKIVGGICDNLVLSVVRAWDTTGELSGHLEEGFSGITDGQSAEAIDAEGLAETATELNTEAATDLQRGQRRLRYGRKKIVVAPAMNTAMWRHPLTKKQIKVLEQDWGGEKGWFEVLGPIEKTLACGDVGDGAMHNWEDIVKVVQQKIDGPRE
jgi:phosphopantothenoylcysteine decarboxylase